MKTFVVAMENEASTVIKNLTNTREEMQYGFHFVRGKLGEDDARVIISDIGKVNASAATSLAIALGSKEIFNIGVAGGFDEKMQPGDLYEIKDAVEYDFDLSELNATRVGTLNELNSPFLPCSLLGRFEARRLGSADHFSNNCERDLPLLRDLGISIRDMEGAAIAHVCARAQIPFYSVKCITNVYSLGAMHEQYKKNIHFCLERLAQFIKELGK